MKVIGLNKIIRDSFYGDIESVVDMKKVDKEGDIYLKDIGDLSRLDVIPGEDISTILNTKINIFSYEFEYIPAYNNLDIQKNIEAIIRLNLDHSIIIVYILLYIFIFDTNSIITENYAKQKDQQLLIKEIVTNIFKSKRISEEENLRSFILKYISNNPNTDKYFSILLTYMQLLIIPVENERTKEEIEKMVNNGLAKIYSNTHYIPFADKNIITIVTNIVIKLIDIDININKTILNDILYDIYDINSVITHDNIAAYKLEANLIEVLLEKNHVDIVLSLISKINILFITELIQTLPKDLLYIKIKNNTLYQHLQYLAIIKGENPAFIKRRN